MLYFSPTRIWSLFLVVALGFFLALPNVLPSSVRSWLPLLNGPVVLGLDLQGGSHVLLEVDQKDLIQQQVQQLMTDLRDLFRQKRIKYHALVPLGERAVSFRLKDPQQRPLTLSALQDFSQKSLSQSGAFDFIGGKNLRGAFDIEEKESGFLVTLTPEETTLKLDRAIEQSLDIVNRRLNALGTTEPIIQRQGRSRILVQLPGLQDPARVKTLLGKTAQLKFQLLCDTQPSETAKKPPFECEDVGVQKNQTLRYWVKNSGRSTVDGGDLNNAWSDFDSQTNQYAVQFHFNQTGALKFAQLTKENVGRPFAIVLDREIVSSPTIQEPILTGSGRITGQFSQQEASDLAIILRSGALPAKLTIVEERTVGPSLGSDSIRAGLSACLFGLVGILLFMVVCYGLFGLFAVVALVVNLVCMIGLLSVFGATLTLPGIAGIVLTMGVAVDSNVLVYERIREEMKAGKSVLGALEAGFKMAFGTIFDANVTMLIAALVLFGVGSGPIRGFAVTLILGIITTVFTAFTFTRLLVSLWVKGAKPKAIPL